MNPFSRVVLASAALLAVPGALPGCASAPPAAVAESTVSASRQLQAEVARTDAEVSSSLDALDRLVGKDVDRGAAYEQFGLSVDSLEADRQVFQRRADNLRRELSMNERERGMDTQRIEDTDLKETAMERQVEAERAMAPVVDAHRAAGANLNAYAAGLGDVRSYLRTDLTDDGMAAIADRVKSTRALGVETRESLKELQAALTGVTGGPLEGAPAAGPATNRM